MKAKRIWIDLENTPHVPFFIPIVLELEQQGFEVILTARDFAQTKDLVEQNGLNARMIGGEYGSNALLKVIGILSRAFGLALYIRRKHVSLAIGHGSRGLTLASKLLGIPSLILYDYEGASVKLFNKLATWVMTPEVLTDKILEPLGLDASKHLTYPGLKEEVYVDGYTPDDSILRELGLDQTKIISVVRPPSDTAHYRAEESQNLFESIMVLLASRKDVQTVLMPRTNDQRAAFKERAWAKSENIIVPEEAVNGLDLLFFSDVVIGGGGTMNREAAVLGVPVLNIFKGPRGAVDAMLVREGKMVDLEQSEDIARYLRKRAVTPALGGSSVRATIIDRIVTLSQVLA
jgi:uncharacterized protein